MNLKRKSVPRRAVRRLLKKLSFQSADILEERLLLSASAVLPATAVEPIGGTGNNVENPTWGAAGTDLIRLTPAQYANGISTPSLPQDASPRIISNIVNNQADPANPSQDVEHGQPAVAVRFRLQLRSVHGSRHGSDARQRRVGSDFGAGRAIPIGGPNDTPLAFKRSQTDPATGTEHQQSGAAGQLRSRSYLDLSQVYGSDLATDNALRTFVGGQMKTSPGGLPPLDNTTYFTPAQLAAINASVGGMADDGPLPESQMFVTGDSRGNENIELTVLQTLFLDNHNRIASRVAEGESDLDRRAAFRGGPQAQHRRVSVDHLQRMDSRRARANALPAYTGYNPNVNATHRQRILDGGVPLRPQPAQRRRRAAGEQRSDRRGRRAAGGRLLRSRRFSMARASRRRPIRSPDWRPPTSAPC